MNPTPDVRDVLASIAAHPVERLIRRWNWKTALLTAVLRGAIFFTANVPAGLEAAAAALGRDLLFRIPLGGLYGALSEAFSRATPVWASYLIVMVIVPAIAHVAEFLVHWLGGTPRLAEAITASIAFSAVSATFNLFLMRRGALLTGEGSTAFGADLRRMPTLIGEFALWGPGWLMRWIRSRRGEH